MLSHHAVISLTLRIIIIDDSTSMVVQYTHNKSRACQAYHLSTLSIIIFLVDSYYHSWLSGMTYILILRLALVHITNSDIIK